MRRPPVPAIAVVLALALVATLASAPACARIAGGLAPAPEGVTDSISIAAVTNYGYEPDTFSNLPTNATITVTFTDDDVLQHSFNISSREGFEIPTDYTAAQLDQLFAQYPALYASTVDAEGDTAVGHFTSPANPGWYEFVCNVSGHFQRGMYGFIAFGEPLPSNLTLPGHSGLGGPSVGSGVIALAGVLIIIAGVVGVLFWRKRRSAYRAPGESPRRP